MPHCKILLAILALRGMPMVIGTNTVLGDENGNDTAPLRRWAVVASPELVQDGFADLTTVALSENSAFELVERQELQAAMRELELAAVGSADAVRQRLRLGQVLKADALLLLSRRPPMAESDGKAADDVLQMVVAESRSGTRLAIEYLPYDHDRLEELAAACSQLVERTRQHFAQGVEQTICVTQFLSKNLVHDYDHLQSGYASLLAQALTEFPGVAVVEIEEAQSIARELQLSGTELSDRNVPLTVRGEFEVVEPTAASAEAQIRLIVELARGEKVTARGTPEDRPLREVAEWLRGPLATAVMRYSSTADPVRMTAQQQRNALLERAEMFAQVGGFEQSTSLREAALLLQPEDLDQQLLLISEYQQGQIARSRQIWSQLVSNRSDMSARPEDDPLWAAAHDEHLAVLRINARHIENLIFRRQVSPREGERLLFNFFEAVQATNNVRYGERIYRAGELLEDFAWRVLPLFHKLDPEVRDGRMHPTLRLNYIGAPPPDDPWPAERQTQTWTKTAIRLLTVRLPMLRPGGSSLKSDPQLILNDLLRFLEQVPTGPSPIEEMATLTMGYQAFDLQGMLRMRRMTVDQLCDFYAQLQQSRHPWNTFYARCGLLPLAIAGYPQVELDRPPAAELADLRAHLNTHASGDEAQSTREHYGRSFDIIEKLIERQTNPQPHIAAPSRPADDDMQNPFRVVPERISFEALPGTFPWEHLTACGDGLDLAWNRQEAVLLPEPVRPTLLHRSGGSTGDIASVHWDGQFVWVVTMGDGIRVFDTQARNVAHFQRTDEEADESFDAELDPRSAQRVSLPPYDRLHRLSLFNSPLQLHPIGPGHAVLIGRYGPHKRLWFAEATVDNDASIRIFHTCTRIRSDHAAPDDDPEQIFGVFWVTEWQQAEDHRRTLLIGRTPENVRWDVGRQPLAIDLETLTVSVFPARFPPFTFAYFPHYSFDGRLLYMAKHRLNIFSPDPESADGWRFESFLNSAERQSKLRDTILDHAGYLYLPGEQWWRIDRKTWDLKGLTPDPLPASIQFTHYAVSSHHGLVAWNPRGRLHRVSVRP